MQKNWLTAIVEDNYWNQSKQTGFNFDDPDDVTIPFTGRPESIETIPKSTSRLQKTSSDVGALKALPRLVIKDAHESHILHKDLKRIIRCIINGENYYLHHIKSKEDKIKLLDLAIESCDGDAIITIILFIEQTLNSELFKYEVTSRPEANNHYINYLKSTNQWDNLINFQSILRRNDDVAITAYSQAIKTKLLPSKISGLKRCRDLYCKKWSAHSELKFISDTIDEQIDLLERQQPIECEDTKTTATQPDPTSMFVQVPRTCLLNQSVISTLMYCCIYHFNVPNTFYASPDLIRKTYSLNVKQYTWTCLRAMAVCQRWQEVDRLFEIKTLLGSKRLKPIIPFVEVVKILHKNEAPNDLVIKYLNMIEDADLKLVLAKEFKYHNLVVQLCVNSKDRQTLLQYLPKLNTKSQEYLYAQDILKLPNFKWKN